MSILAFQMPDRVIMEKADDFQGTFEFKPLEPGYGVTIGNALRRIMINSLEGFAVTAVRIPGVTHEFSTIDGVVEDVNEIILNLKRVRFKKVGEVLDNSFTVKVSGTDVFNAGIINDFNNSFEVLNADQPIAHLEEGVELELDLTVDKGRGYVPSEEHDISELPEGTIAIDSTFSPVKNVKYAVENTRVEQKTDYQKLILDITTDGSIHPEDVLKGAANILIKHFMLFSDQNMTLESMEQQEEQVIDEETLHMRKLLKTPLSDLDLSVRAFNCLKAADIKTLGDLAQLEISDMMKFRNFGKKSLSELEALMEEKGLHFGMDVSHYMLEQN